MLTVDTIPLRQWHKLKSIKARRHRSPFILHTLPLGLLRFFVTGVLTASPAELLELEPVGGRLLVLRRHVVPTLAFSALKRDVIAWHKLNFRSLIFEF